MITTDNIRNTRAGRYAGRRNATYGLAGSPFANPFRLLNEKDRFDVLLQFAEWWYAPEQKALRQEALDTFSPNEVLLCWCKPKPCHTDIEAGYVNAKRAGLI